MKKIEPEILAKKAEQLRVKKEWTRGQLMRYLKISPATMHRWENGWKNIQIDTYHRVGTLLEKGFESLKEEKKEKDAGAKASK